MRLYEKDLYDHNHNIDFEDEQDVETIMKKRKIKHSLDDKLEHKRLKMELDDYYDELQDNIDNVPW